MREILTMLRIRTGHDFANYKPGTVHRRVARRIHLRHLPDLQSYARFLRENPEEGVTLMKELLISVTNFFRDPLAFDALTAKVLPQIIEEQRGEPDSCLGSSVRHRRGSLFADHAARRAD